MRNYSLKCQWIKETLKCSWVPVFSALNSCGAKLQCVIRVHASLSFQPTLSHYRNPRLSLHSLRMTNYMSPDGRGAVWSQAAELIITITGALPASDPQPDFHVSDQGRGAAEPRAAYRLFRFLKVFPLCGQTQKHEGLTQKRSCSRHKSDINFKDTVCLFSFFVLMCVCVCPLLNVIYKYYYFTAFKQYTTITMGIYTYYCLLYILLLL